MRQENQKEFEFLEKLSSRFDKIDKMIGDLSQLPTSDKSSIVNSIKTLSVGSYQEPQIDPDEIINVFNSKLI